ncbi:hypothetical protein BEN51_08800 [Clostridium isatidis]|uniref:DUF3892 domain-containing protein n=2 Tax=Clostridium isatidis TaxID=182773 RepID=A0A343JDG9_9CLOT|nr:hypothetical protein BEN51_08800 [Clostridium isatidis]
MVLNMKITAVKKDSNGTITEYKLDNGTVINQEQAIQMAENHQLEGCNVGTARNGKKYIRSNADGDESNNLDQLPTF